MQTGSWGCGDVVSQELVLRRIGVSRSVPFMESELRVRVLKRIRVSRSVPFIKEELDRYLKRKW